VGENENVYLFLKRKGHKTARELQFLSEETKMRKKTKMCGEDPNGRN